MESTLESLAYESDKKNIRSDDENSYRVFASKMASRIGLNNQSESVDVLIDELKKSKYYATL